MPTAVGDGRHGDKVGMEGGWEYHGDVATGIAANVEADCGFKGASGWCVFFFKKGSAAGTFATTVQCL